ncbi:hypothetical protein BD410DRAFT_789367 [Rickenella mellea]|uniref:Zn(2)-C6 fungal-type domain-containing protein n=1 Tax=Rickenella mellea TaxID=50990 RepID=A0A4Y7Q2G3_9AGAM|nr:hypothetical protein BD410DRAFT_789367 [Rickenella mellea]
MSGNHPSSSRAVLPRGSACLNCRSKKIKCDGMRPRCGPCSISQSFCSYTTDVEGRTLIQALEDQVESLTTRVHELSPPVILHHPYERGGDPARMPSGSSSSSRHISRSSTHARRGSPTATNNETLVNTFMQHTEQLGFALNISRFLDSLNVSSLNHRSQPHPALLNSVYLWGSRLSFSNSASQDESQYLEASRLALVEALSHRNPRIRIETIQTEVLLAQYYFYCGRSLEGQYHANAAISLAYSSGLHHFRPPQPVLPRRSLTGPSDGFSLPQPTDAIEEGERINLFWAAYNINSGWSVAIGSEFLREGQLARKSVDIPWPFEGVLPEQGRSQSRHATHPPSVRNTIQNFLTERAVTVDESGGLHVISLHAKASVAFYYAALIAAGRSGADVPTFESLDSTIARLVASIPSMDHIKNWPSDKRSACIVTRNLALSSCIQLHRIRVEVNPQSYSLCLASSRAIVEIMECVVSARIRFMDPVICITWMVAVSFFSWDISRRGGVDIMRSRVEKLGGEGARIRAALSGVMKLYPIIDRGMDVIPNFNTQNSPWMLL